MCDEFFRRESNGKLGDIISEEKKSTIKVRAAKDLNGEYPFFISGDAVLSCDKPLLKIDPFIFQMRLNLRRLIALLCLLIRLYRIINAKIEL